MNQIINGQVVELTQAELDTIAAERQARAVPRAIKAKRREILQQYSAAVAQIKGGYDQNEIDSWPKQEAQARAYLADPEALGLDFLHNLAWQRGTPVPTLAERIMLKVAEFEVAFSTALGTRDRRLTALADIDLEAPNTLDLINNV